jgi:hypothetical protein
VLTPEATLAEAAERDGAEIPAELLFDPRDRAIPLPAAIHKISAKFGSGLPPFVRNLRELVFAERTRVAAQRAAEAPAGLHRY